eukprot:3256580-Prorocentrum_lima.AAC.1
MADINQKTNFFFIHILLVFFHHPFHLVFFASKQNENNLYHNAYASNDAERNEPPASVPGWQYV